MRVGYVANQIDYAAPKKREKRPLSQMAKWTLIVVGLIAATVLSFLVLFIRYVMSIGPLDSH
jgi:hypothetical protein